MYYNTNQEKGEDLSNSRTRATSQTQLIYNYFVSNPTEELTPFEFKAKIRMSAPITSIRRAITDLTNEGKLVKTNSLKQGNYGKKCHCWRLA